MIAASTTGNSLKNCISVFHFFGVASVCWKRERERKERLRMLRCPGIGKKEKQFYIHPFHLTRSNGLPLSCLVCSNTLLPNTQDQVAGPSSSSAHPFTTNTFPLLSNPVSMQILYTYLSRKILPLTTAP